VPGFFEAMASRRKKIVPSPTVIIDGKKIEVDAKKYKEIEMHGAHAYTLKDGEIVRKPKKSAVRTYLQLRKSDGKGYVFENGNPYWPTDLVKGGCTWQKKQE